MKIWTSHDFTGHYSVGTALVVCAENETDAIIMCELELKEHGLVFDGTLTELRIDAPKCRVLNDGDY